MMEIPGVLAIANSCDVNTISKKIKPFLGIEKLCEKKYFYL